jgi:hypothetical protein
MKNKAAISSQEPGAWVAHEHRLRELGVAICLAASTGLAGCGVGPRQGQKVKSGAKPPPAPDLIHP